MEIQPVPANKRNSLAPNGSVAPPSFPPAIGFQFDFLDRQVSATTRAGPLGVAPIDFDIASGPGRNSVSGVFEWDHSCCGSNP